MRVSELPAPLCLQQHSADEIEGDLVRRLKRGSAEAITEVYDRHHGPVRAFARRLVGDDAAAEDLVHEVFVSLPDAFSRFQGASSIRTFLITIAANQARHHLRSASRRRAAMDKLAVEPAQVAAAPASAPILLVIGILPWGVDADVLRARLASELGAEMVDAAPPGRSLRGKLALETTPAGQITARFEGSDGQVTQRTIALPTEPDRALDTIVLLAGNVARDEAAELRAELARGAAEGGTRPEGARNRAPSPPASSEPAPSAASTAPSRAKPAPPRAAPAQLPPAHRSSPQCAAAEGQRSLAFGADLVPMLGTSLVARRAVRNVSFNLVGGLAGGLDGVEIGSAFNIVTGSACGLQIAGAVNVAWEQAHSVQIAGAVNVAWEQAHGAQIAGAVNLGGAVRGAQIAGGANVATTLYGAQIGPINLSTGETSGAPIGVIDLGRDLHGAQIGVIDVAEDVHGLQLGVVNVAKRVRGAQLGVVNVADDSDFSLGVVSIVRRGRLHVDVWGAETGLLMAAVKHGGRSFHNFYGAGIRLEGGKPRVAFALGLGGHVPLSRRFFLDIDGLAYNIHETANFAGSNATLAQLRAVLGWRLARGFAVIAGPSYNVIVAERAEDASISALGSSLFHTEPGLFVRGWPGIALGVQAF
jgi:RNA polymerase sigma factor (sigma-70 family)